MARAIQADEQLPNTNHQELYHLGQAPRDMRKDLLLIVAMADTLVAG